MKATLLFKERVTISSANTVHSLIWQVPEPVLGSSHLYKYSLAYVVNDVCVLRYDNERAKGDHRHLGVEETSYAFTTIDQLYADFWVDVIDWRRE